MKIGVLALQGDFSEHTAILEKLGVEVIAVRQPGRLDGLDGLVIPGGESTTMLNLMRSYGLFQPLKELIQNGLPVMGTCAGMILLAKKVTNTDMDTLGVMDIEVRRNAFGRQIDSFEADLDIPLLGNDTFPAVFIRAPFIEDTGSGVEILSRLPNGTIVSARQDNLLVLSFHPELNNDSRLHRYFLETVKAHTSRSAAIQAC